MERGRTVHTGGYENGVWTERDVWVEYTEEEYRLALRERLEERREALRRTDSVLLEALESILGATTLTGLLAAVISAGQDLRDTLTERLALRGEIRELEKEE